MEEEILQLFSYNKELKFNEIEKLTKIRSNKLSYYLKGLIQKGILEKRKNTYQLSYSYEYLVPYLSDKKSVLPVILIVIKKDEKIFLVKRDKLPFKEKLALPGGRMILGETIEESCERIAKKFGIKCIFKEINSVSLELVKNNKRIIHSFLLILVSAKTKDNLNFLDIERNKSRIVSSDYNLIKNNLSKRVEIERVITKI